MIISVTVLLVRALMHEFARVSQAIIEDFLQQAAGNLPRKEFESIYHSLAHPAASCRECARYYGSWSGSIEKTHRFLNGLKAEPCQRNRSA
jgi:hypothetical protein